MTARARVLWNRIQSSNGRLALLTAILLLGFALRVVSFTADRFHADEALYAGWALLIPNGDPMLLSVPVDKPPLYLYTLAGSTIAFGRSEVAARLPSLASSTLGVVILYRLGRLLYAPPTGILAALLIALSPFDILFARTAFTDSMLVLWMLAALWAAAAGRWFVAGIALGLAFATKQHALFLIPLVVGAGCVHALQARCNGARGSQTPSEHKVWIDWILKRAKELLAYALGFALPFAGVVAWDSARWIDRPSYWHQSASSYGGLAWAPLVEWGERLVEWIGWARYLAGSRVLGILIVLGIGALLVDDWRRRPGTRQTWLDTLLVAYGLGYVLMHTVLQFSIWDRYLLPLVPLMALLVGRIAVQIDRAARRDWEGPGKRLTDSPLWPQVVSHSNAPEKALLRALRVANRLRFVVVVLLLLSAWTAAQNGYPVGGEHWAYQGLDQVAAYLIENAPPDAVIYHHWLRWHYTYYLYGTDFELRWWASGEHLRQEALRTPERAQYIVLPDWRTLEPDVAGIAFHQVYETRRRDGSISLTVHRVEPQRPAIPTDGDESGSEGISQLDSHER